MNSTSPRTYGSTRPPTGFGSATRATSGCSGSIPDGRFLGSVGENGNRPGYLARPRGLATDSDGHVFVSDAAFEAVQVFDDKKNFLLFVGRAGVTPGQFNMPGGVFIDGRDRVYVADTQNARVQVFQYVKEVQP